MDTEFAEKKRKLDEMNRKRLHEQKKNLLLDLKHHPDLEYDEELLLNDENDQLLNKEDVGIVNVLFSTHGAIIFGSFSLLLLLDYIIDMTDGKKKRKVHTK